MRTNTLSIILLLFVKQTVQYSNKFFNHWQCVGIKEHMDFSKPTAIRVGELPLVLWKNNNGELITALNICKHMGSTLDNGRIAANGCLKCQYHGLEFSAVDKFGDTVEHEGKIFWAFEPTSKSPPKIPFFNNKRYVKSYLEIDMDCSLTDSAFNTIDVRHPEYVHSLGFGNKNPPSNIKQFKYPNNDIGLSFEYSSNRFVRTINDNTKYTKNFHMYSYPTFSWSRVSFNDNHLFVAVNLLPITTKKTRWYITLCHNYYTSHAGQEIMKILATTILSQDYIQMRNQYPENELKREVLLGHAFENEEAILWLKDLFDEKYKYPDIGDCADLYNYYRKT